MLGVRFPVAGAATARRASRASSRLPVTRVRADSRRDAGRSARFPRVVVVRDTFPRRRTPTFLVGRGKPRVVARAVSDERTSAASFETRPGDRTEGDGSKDWISLTVLAALAIFVCYADRSNISTAIIPMSKEFGWDKVAEGGVLSAFFYGYGSTQIIGGRAADNFGGKNVLLFGVLAWSLATFFTPAAALAGAAPLALARACLGAGEGVAFPAVHALIARHVPVDRRTTAVATVTAASYAGAAFAFGATPHVVLAGGWSAAFYSFGAAALVWVPFWVPATFQVIRIEGVGGEHPVGEHPAHPSAEISNAPEAVVAGRYDEWIGLIKTREVRAICVAQFAQSWGSYGLLSWLPTYFDEALGVSLSDLPQFTVFPYLIQGVVGVFSGVCADSLIRNERAKKKTIRRAFQAVGMIGPAACLLAAAWLGNGGVDGRVPDANVDAAVLFVDLGLALSALTLAGVSVSHLDVAPRHAGLVFATGNTCATVAGLLAVPASGLILELTNQNWSVVFGVIAFVFIVGAGVWVAWVGDSPVAADEVVKTS
jgi:ACS family sodium-dependent inorganic phosphate cotransporter